MTVKAETRLLDSAALSSLLLGVHSVPLLLPREPSDIEGHLRIVSAPSLGGGSAGSQKEGKWLCMAEVLPSL